MVHGFISRWLAPLSCPKSALSSAAWRADTSHDTCTPQEVGATSYHDAEEEENRKDTGDKHHRVLPSIMGRLGRVPDVTPQPIAPADVLIRGSPARRLTEEAEFSSAGSTRKPVGRRTFLVRCLAQATPCRPLNRWNGKRYRLCALPVRRGGSYSS